MALHDFGASRWGDEKLGLSHAIVHPDFVAQRPPANAPHPNPPPRGGRASWRYCEKAECHPPFEELLFIPHRRRVIGWLMLAIFATQGLRADDAPVGSKSTVGMPKRIEQLVLPGTELEVRPIDDRRAPIVVRIVNTYPHGSAFRYDIVYYGLEPGPFDLKDWLRRKDGSSTGDLPPVPVVIEPLLPPGQLEPHRLALGTSPWLGGYRLLMIIGGLAWLGGLAAIVLAGRRKRAHSAAAAGRVVTLADRLRPLVNSAMAGELSAGQHAELERLLIGYWRRRLNLEQAAPAKLIALLRNHDEAGPLLRQLEDWLHRPAGSVGPVDVAALLRPYQAIAADDLDETAAGATPAMPGAGPRTAQERTR
jgi:hypothetical protein